MSKGKPNKRYTLEFKQQVIKAVIRKGLGHKGAAKLYDVQEHDLTGFKVGSCFIRRRSGSPCHGIGMTLENRTF